MKKSSLSWSVKQLTKMIEKGTISFDYPIQRQGGQWGLEQKSLLIHSLADDYPVPALYSIVQQEEIYGKEISVYYILDGKQRLTSIVEFIRNEYLLHKDTPPVEIDGVEHELSRKRFEDLHEDVQDQILSYSLLIYRMDEATDEEIEDLFYRLNNGTPLSKVQKSKAKMGLEWSEKIKELVEHPMMKKASFTELQKRKADHETAILQTMMLLDDGYFWKSISSNEVLRYSQTFKGDENKQRVATLVKEAMDYLNEAIKKEERVLLKKVHFPMTICTALKAKELNVPPQTFSQWMEEFKLSLKGEGSIETEYKNYAGAGSVKKEKTLGRIKEMQKHFEEYLMEKMRANADEVDVDADWIEVDVAGN